MIGTESVYRCPLCGQEQKSKGRCLVCGRVLTEQTLCRTPQVAMPVTMSASAVRLRICPKCGSVVPQTSLFCPADQTRLDLLPLLHPDQVIPSHLLILAALSGQFSLNVATRDEVIGRALTGRVQLLTDPYISRNHARILFHESRFWIMNLSSNGTWLDDVAVTGWVPLHDRQHLRLGRTVLTVRIERR